MTRRNKPITVGLTVEEMALVDAVTDSRGKGPLLRRGGVRAALHAVRWRSWEDLLEASDAQLEVWVDEWYRWRSATTSATPTPRPASGRE